MKLELKHIAPYLPYNIQARDVGNHDKIIKNNAILATVACTYPHAIKPLLRPMSDLFKEIEHQGQTGCVAELIASMDEQLYYSGNPEIYDDEQGFNLDFESKNFLNGLKYFIVKTLFQYHFDVFGLIDKGLAEPIKTE